MRTSSNVTLLLCLCVLLTADAVSAQVIHVYATGTDAYIGSAGLKQALVDATEGGTIYVHSGSYDLGAAADSFLTIAKGLSLIGYDEGAGKPVIKGARPTGSPGLVLINAPLKTILLENLEFSFHGVRAIGSNDTAVSVAGSASFTLRNCTITGAYFDGTNNVGLASVLSIAGPARSELDPASPTHTSRFNVTGTLKIQNSRLTSLVNNIGIGFFGPVRLDNIEVSNCTLTALGSTQLGSWAKGNFGILITQYPFYMNDANRSLLIEATHAGTQTLIRDNNITSPNTIWLLYLKGTQRLERNRLNSLGSWYSAGKYYQAAIAAFGYPHAATDPTTYSEALIRENVIELQVPPFPIRPSNSFAPPQTTGNSMPPVGIWLGVGEKLFYNSTIIGHHARVTVSGNILSSRGAPIPYRQNDPAFGISLAGEMKECLIADNQLAGGWQLDPVTSRLALFSTFTAKAAQLYVAAAAHHNLIQRNAFGFGESTGVLCHGHNNKFENNHFFGAYRGWEPGPGLFWLTSTAHANLIVTTKLNAPPFGFNICRQIRSENGGESMLDYRCAQ